MRHLMLAGLLLLVGCSTGAEFVDSENGNQEIIVFGGRLEEAEVDRHDFTLQNSGSVKFTMTSLQVSDAATGEPIGGALLAVVLGRPQEDNTCKTSSTNFLPEGGDFLLFLVVEQYCLRVARGSSLPPDSLVDYVLTLTVGFE